jgi:phage baseplate assembly protein W
MATTHKFSDFDIDFNRNTFVDDISVKKDINSIRQSVMNIVLTVPGEKPFQRDFGVGLRRELFELWTPYRKAIIERNIIAEVNRLEPRVEVYTVNFDDESIDSNQIGVIIRFRVLLGERSEPIEDSIRISLVKVR